jgi:hypothetical protein
VLATEPSPDLAITLPGEWRGDQDLADQPEQVGIADRVAGPGRSGGSVRTRRA